MLWLLCLLTHFLIFVFLSVNFVGFVYFAKFSVTCLIIFLFFYFVCRNFYYWNENIAFIYFLPTCSRSENNKILRGKFNVKAKTLSWNLSGWRCFLIRKVKIKRIWFSNWRRILKIQKYSCRSLFISNPLHHLSKEFISISGTLQHLHASFTRQDHFHPSIGSAVLTTIK